MILYKCIKGFPNGPKVGDILRRGNHVYDYVSKDTKDPITISSKIVENSKEFFKFVDWLPGSFKNTNNGNIYTLSIDKFPKIEYHGTACTMSLNTCLPRYQINSILTISTGEIFTVGQHVVYSSYPSTPQQIQRFFIKDDIIFAVYEGSCKGYDDFLGPYCKPFHQEFITEDGIPKQTGDEWYYIPGTDVRNNFEATLKEGPTLITDGIVDGMPDALRFHTSTAAIDYARTHKNYPMSVVKINKFLEFYTERQGKAVSTFGKDLFIEFLNENDTSTNNN